MKLEQTENGFNVYVKCVNCGEEQTIHIPDEEKLKQLIQALERQINFSELSSWMSADDREMFISGFCPKCWNEIFEDED